MKTRSLAIILILSLSCPFYARADEKNTAKFVAANKATLVGKSVNLHVTHLTPVERKNAPSGLSLFLANTYDEKEHVRGGTIVIMATAADAEKLKKKFGITPKIFGRNEKKAITKTLKGKVGIHGKGNRPYVTVSKEAEAMVESKQ